MKWISILSKWDSNDWSQYSSSSFLPITSIMVSVEVFVSPFPFIWRQQLISLLFQSWFAKPMEVIHFLRVLTAPEPLNFIFITGDYIANVYSQSFRPYQICFGFLYIDINNFGGFWFIYCCMTNFARNCFFHSLYPNGTMIDTTSENCTLLADKPLWFTIHGWTANPFSVRWLTLVRCLVTKVGQKVNRS